ncbi:MAG: LysR family transcriptional regulator [Bacteriovoracia bacterium]
MIIDSLNLNHIRVFECVYRSGSMTTAAKEMHLTQSGVSQHMKSLEDVIGIKLFDRVNQRLVPTAQGRSLFEYCTRGLQEIESALVMLKQTGGNLVGNVRIGMPIEFGNNVVVPHLGTFSKKHPMVSFQIVLDFASVMNDLLLKGDLDFAFVDDFPMDRRVKTEEVYDEVLDLCISPELLKRFGPPKHDRKYYESLEYVDYQSGEPILRKWFAHHLGHRHVHLSTRATVMDVQAIARLISSGVGAGVLPHHLVAKMVKEGVKLYRFRGCGKPMKNTISLAYMKDRTHSPAAQEAILLVKKAVEQAGRAGSKLA